MGSHSSPTELPPDTVETPVGAVERSTGGIAPASGDDVVVGIGIGIGFDVDVDVVDGVGLTVEPVPVWVIDGTEPPHWHERKPVPSVLHSCVDIVPSGQAHAAGVPGVQSAVTSLLDACSLPVHPSATKAIATSAALHSHSFPRSMCRLYAAALRTI